MLKQIKLLSVGIILAILAGCSTLGVQAPSLGAETPAQAIFVAKSGYATALRGAVAYKELPACSATLKVVCSDPKIVAQIQKADVVAFQAISSAQSAVDTIGGSVAQSAVSAAQAALKALTTVLSSR